MIGEVRHKFKPQNIFSTVFFISLAGVLMLIFDFGFDKDPKVQMFINGLYFLVLVSGIFVTIYRYLRLTKTLRINVVIFDAITNLIILFVIGAHFFGIRNNSNSEHINLLYSDNTLKLSILFTFLREFAARKISFQRNYLNPGQLFFLSFLVIILVGTIILKLPNSTYDGISWLDAFFTSTSAVCVTGLIVVDTATYFTTFGQSVIMILIQFGGLGILTFVSYFSYFFKGGSSFENQIVLQDMTSSDKIGEVFKMLKNILLITFIIEFLGGIFIYFSINSMTELSFEDQVFFSIFHSVSAFCNAGFSTLTNSLNENGYQYNYNLHLSIIFLLVVGGLGFPIVSNSLYYLKYKFLNIISPLTRQKKKIKPWIFNLTSRITISTTLTLIVIGTIFFYFSEFHHTLSDHSNYGKIVTALFESTTPRTAGFNTVNMNNFSMPTLIFVIFLMWIGASPASTGGGIKTSTFAIAIMNFISIARGKDRVEIYRRQISDFTIRRAFGVIILSLLTIGGGIILISINDGDKGLLNIIFESFSAYSTVGLSLGITSSLTEYSKFVLIALMFLGRVGMMTFLFAIIKKEKYSNYRYPNSEILIN
ncbi:MAG: potassium transporter TrkG [Saprospiraceae bacterium]